MKRITYILFLIIFLIGLSSCNTKKKISTTQTKTQTNHAKNIDRNTERRDMAIIDSQSTTKSNIIEESILSFDSIISVTINPDRSIHATGRGFKITKQRTESIQTDQTVHIDTTKTEKTQETISDQKTETVITTEIEKDIKRKTSFAFIQLGFIIIIGMGLIYWGLKKYF